MDCCIRVAENVLFTRSPTLTHKRKIDNDGFLEGVILKGVLEKKWKQMCESVFFDMERDIFVKRSVSL